MTAPIGNLTKIIYKQGLDGQIGPAGPAGPAGPQGPQGVPGPQGLAGTTGATGPQGLQGYHGPTGPAGVPGPMPDHEVSQGMVRFKKPDGSWGQWVQQRGGGNTANYAVTGPVGPAGPQGPAGTGANVETGPALTYTSGVLTLITYDSGNYKVFTYTSSVLTQLDYIVGAVTTRKTFNYNLDGTLASIDQTVI